MAEHSSDKIKKLLNSTKAFFVFKTISLTHLEQCYNIESTANKSISKRTKQNLSDFLTKYKCFGIFNEETLIGFAVFSICEETAELIDITIDINHRKKSLGFELLKNSFSYLKESNVTEIILEVAEDNVSAINLYKKFNSEQINIRKKYYSAPNSIKIDAVVHKIIL